MKNLYQKYKHILFLGIVFIILFTMCYYGHYTADDYNYSHIPWTTEKLTGISSIIRSQLIMYQKWSGRVLFSGLGQLFLFANKGIFALFNSLIFIALIILIHNFFGKNKINLKLLILSFILIWTFTPSFVEDFIWISGSVNYLWPVFFTCLFISLFYQCYILNKKINKWFILGLSFIVGLSSELSIFVSGSSMLLMLVFNFKKTLKMVKTKDCFFLFSLFFYLLGACICIFAPGNFNRASSSLSFNIHHVIYNFWCIKEFLCILLLFLIYQFISNKEKLFTYTKYILLPIAISLIPMCFISEFPPRAMLIYIVLFCILIIDSIKDILIKYKVFNHILIEIILLICSLYTPVKVANYYATTMKEYNHDVSYAVLQSRYSSNKDIIVNQLMIPNSKIEKYVLGADHRPGLFKSSILSEYFCHYYGCNSIVAKNKDNVIVTIKSKNQVKLKINNNLYESKISNNPADLEREFIYAFEIPRDRRDDFLIITKENKIENVEIRDLDDQKEYQKDEFDRVILK